MASELEKLPLDAIIPKVSKNLDQKSLVNLSLACKWGSIFTREERIERLKTELSSQKWKPLSPDLSQKLKRILASLQCFDDRQKVYCLIQEWLKKHYQEASESKGGNKYVNYSALLVQVKSHFGILGYISPDFVATVANQPELRFQAGYLIGLYCIQEMSKKNDMQLINIFNSAYPNLITSNDSKNVLVSSNPIEQLITKLQTDLPKENDEYISQFKKNIQEAKKSSEILLKQHYPEPTIPARVLSAFDNH